MDRFILTDAQWAKIEPHCLGKPSDPGRSGRNNRLFLEAVLWIVRTDSPWRDLPALFGNWSTAFRRFRDWREADVFKRIFDAMVDATIVKVHRHGQGAKGGLRARPSVAPRWHDDQNPGAHGCLGNVVRFHLMPDHRFDTVGVAPLIDSVEFGAFIAYKAFDSNTIIADLNVRDAKIVISPHPRRAISIPLDTEMYKWHHLIENFFCKLKECRRIAMRACKTDRSFEAMIYLAAVINSR